MARFFVLASLLASGWLSVAAAGQQAPSVKMQSLNVSDNLYVLSGGGGNSLALVTDAGVVLVDRRGWLLLQERDEHPVIDPALRHRRLGLLHHGLPVQACLKACPDSPRQDSPLLIPCHALDDARATRIIRPMFLDS